ncbi:MAG: DUF4421 family protein [Eudoraea sp.]|nr:DUF4421 family protein [Eudoraea sp.]
MFGIDFKQGLKGIIFYIWYRRILNQMPGCTKLLLISFICCCFGFLQAQEPAYILDYSDKLLLRLYTISKVNSLTIENRLEELGLELLPNGNTNLGLGFNYKKFGLGLAFGLPLSAEKKRKFGKTQRLDIQGSMYGRKIGADGFLQSYRGYYNSNPTDFIDWTSDVLPQIKSMRILSLGVTGFYLFNSDKYSYRAAFVRDEIQKKSAGSFLLGLFGNYDEARTDAGFVPQEFPDSLRTKINVKGFKNLAIGFSAGYAHNFVIKEKFLLGLAIIPGFGYQRVSITELNGSIRNEDQPAGQVMARIGLGYEFKPFYLALTGSANWRNIDFSPYNFKLATEQFRFIIGKRLGI